MLLRAENSTGFKNVYPKSSTSKPFQAQLRQSRLTKNLGSFATAEEAARPSPASSGRRARAAARPQAPRIERRRPLRAAEQAGQAAGRRRRGGIRRQGRGRQRRRRRAAGAPAPPVLCYCERPAALLDGRWVCAQLVEGDFCICGREDEADSD